MLNERKKVRAEFEEMSVVARNQVQALSRSKRSELGRNVTKRRKIQNKNRGIARRKERWKVMMRMATLLSKRKWGRLLLSGVYHNVPY